MFSIFTIILLTDNNKIVRKYAHKFNTRKIYSELYTHFLSSTKASIEATDLLTYTASVNIGDSTWRSYTEIYIAHWIDKNIKYINLTNTDVFSVWPNKYSLKILPVILLTLDLSKCMIHIPIQNLVKILPMTIYLCWI